MRATIDTATFLRHLDEILELTPGTLTGAERLEDLEGWDSLAVISFIAMADERYGVIVEGEKLAASRHVSDLLALVERGLAG